MYKAGKEFIFWLLLLILNLINIPDGENQKGS